MILKVQPWFYAVEYLSFFVWNCFVIFYEYGLICYYFVATCANANECIRLINLYKYGFAYLNIALLLIDLGITEFTQVKIALSVNHYAYERSLCIVAIFSKTLQTLTELYIIAVACS